MATELTPTPFPQMVDLTGLPEPAVQAIRQLVQALREQHTTPPNGGASAGPKWTADPFPKYISDPQLTDEEFRRNLREMASMGTGKVLPPDFSRADIYDDHD